VGIERNHTALNLLSTEVVEWWSFRFYAEIIGQSRVSRSTATLEKQNPEFHSVGLSAEHFPADTKGVNVLMSVYTFSLNKFVIHNSVDAKQQQQHQRRWQ
jgi:hypothetical protein